MVPMELTACLSAVETVRIITLVTGQMEHVFIVLLDGKIKIVTKVRKFEKSSYIECAFFIGSQDCSCFKIEMYSFLFQSSK